MNKLRPYTFCALLSGALFISLNTFGQQMPKKEADPPKDWHTMDLKTDGFYGISLKQAYQFVKGKKSKTVVVTTIDSGIDTTQNDLKTILWVNPKEIPNNGKDDDGDGYIDDVHGWDFLGGKGGKVDFTETTEEVRQYNKLKDKWGTVTAAPAGQEKEYAYWQRVKTIYDSTITKSKAEINDLTTEVNVLTATNFYIKRELKLASDQTFNISDLAKINTTNDTIAQSKTVWQSVFTQIGESTNNA